MQLMLAQKCAECRPDAFQMQVPTGSGRFAPGNELERKNGKDGMRTLVTEKRELMQTEEKRKLQREKSLGI